MCFLWRHPGPSVNLSQFRHRNPSTTYKSMLLYATSSPEYPTLTGRLSSSTRLIWCASPCYVRVSQAYRRQRTKSHRGEKPVGLSADITLARRVQLAVLAHIRHTHTRYDKLRKETTWTNARRVVEALCLDILVKWRGDEETGRDQLDEILREVVVISDSEDSEDEDADISSPESDGSIEIISAPAEPTILPTDLNLKYQAPQMPPAGHQQSPRARAGRPRAAGKKEQRGFKRYRAWQEAIQRNRAQDQLPDTSSMHESTGHGSFPEGIGSGPQSFPSSHRPPPGDGRANSLLDPLPLQHSASPGSAFRGRPSFPGRTPLQHMMPLRRDSAPPQRPLSPPIQDRFKDLLVQSIESPSPDHTQPAFIRVLPPEKSELQKHLVAHESRPLRADPPAPCRHPRRECSSVSEWRPPTESKWAWARLPRHRSNR
jgi:hypothetical protein